MFDGFPDFLLAEGREVRYATEEESEFPVWAIWTIVGCSVAALAVIIAIPVVIAQKKKAAKKVQK